MAKKYRTYNAITGKFGDEEDYSVDFTSQEPVQFKTYNAISGKFSYKPENTVANTVDTLNTVSNNIKNNSVDQTVTMPKNNNISYYKKGNDLYKEEQIGSNVNGETDTYTYKTTKIKDKKEKNNILKDKSINIEDRTKKSKETNEYDTNLEKYFTDNGKVYENKKVLAGTDNGKNIYVYEPVEITDKKEAERLKNAPGVYARDLKTRNKQIEAADAEERALNNLEKLYSGKTYLNELENKDTWEYLRDGYNFGDITRTANKIAELKVAEPLTKVGMELKNDPKQTLKTMGVAFPAEVKNTFSSVGDTMADFGNWISKKGYELGIEDEYDPNAKEHYHMKKEYKKILEKNDSKEIEEYFSKIKNEYENGTLPKAEYDYMKWDTVNNYLLNNGSKEEIRKYIKQLEKEYKNGDLDATNYQNFKASFNYYLGQRRPETGEFNLNESQNKVEKAVDKVLGFNVEDTETYKKHEAGELSEGQEYVWNQTGQVAQQVPVMAMSTVPYVGPAVGKAFFFAQAQNNYYEEAQQRGYTDSNARKYSIIMGAFETLIEEREGLNPFGGTQALKETAKEGMIDAVKGEAFEEFITPYADYGVRALFGEKYDLGAATDEAIDGAFSAAVTTLILGSAGKGMNYVDAIANKMSNGEKFTSQELTNAVKQIEANNPGAVTDQINIYLNDLKSSGILEDVQQQDIQTSIQEEEKNRTAQEVEQKDIENSVNAFNLNEDLQLEENLDENIQEAEQEVTQDIDDIESLIANISRTEVTRDLENYVQENNIEQLTKEDIQNFVEQAIAEQNLNEENKELLRNKYNEIAMDYLEAQNKAKVPDEVKPLAQPVLEQETTLNAPKNASTMELRENKGKGKISDSKIAQIQDKVGNQLETQYKGFENLGRVRMQPSAKAVNFDEKVTNQRKGRRAENVTPIVTREAAVTTTLGNNEETTKEAKLRANVKAMTLDKGKPFNQVKGNYKYVESENKKIDNFRRDAATYLKDIPESTVFAKVVEKIIKDKNLEVRLDPNLKSKDGRVANGSYGNGIITLNPNSRRAAEFLLMHEVTHSIASKDMIDIIKTYREGGLFGQNANAEFNENVEKLLKSYSKGEINEEALADISGQLFGNQEFINNLSMEKPSIFKRLYNEIKYLWHQFRGYKSQNEFIEDLYNKWTQAYRENLVKQTNKSSKVEMSNQVDSTGNKLSADQVKYFEKSKVRDKNGNLMPMYHGSRENFNIFDKSKISKRPDGIKGFFFAPESRRNSVAGYYTQGQNDIKEVYLDIKNPLYLESNAQEDDIIKNLYDTGKISDYDGIIRIADTDFPENSYYNYETGEMETESLKKGDIIEVIAFEPNQIKNTDNLTPTENDDIRYSIEETNDGTKYVVDNKLKKDNNLTEKDVFNSLKNKEYTFEDGDKAYIAGWLKSNDKNIKNKYMYDELFKRHPSIFKNIEDIKDFNRLVNYNTDELLKTSKKTQDAIKDIENKHKAWNIESFDTRQSILYDDTNDKAYLIDFSVANLKDGKKIAYAKKMAQASSDILNKIKTSSMGENSQIAGTDNNISQNNKNVKPLEQQVMEDAKNKYGTTENFKYGAYMTTDGELLDFQNGNQRNEHDDFELNDVNPQKFGEMGAIRIAPEHSSFEMKVEPTREQYSKLEDLIEYLKDEEFEDQIYIDINDNGKYNGFSVPIDTNTNKIINTIKNYWNEAKTTNTKYSIDEDTGKLQEDGKDVKLDTSNTGTTGTLMAIHNLSEDKLKGILELGGFPVPSIAITNPNVIDHNGYGNISVLFDKSTIDPAVKENEVYDRDIWSPKFPQVDREILDKNIDKAAPKIGMSDSSLQSLAEDYNNVDDLAYRLSRDADVVEKYLNDNKIKYDNDTNIYNLAKDNGIVEFLTDQLKDVYGEKGIWNQKGYLTDNGNRRTFWQTHDKYNLENIVKQIIKQKTVGSHVDFTGEGFGNLQARMTNKLKSIEDIKKNESKIMTKADADAVVSQLADRLNDSMVKLSKLYGKDFDPLWDMDSINYQLQELSRQKNVTADEYYRIANTYNKTLAKADKNTVQDIVDTMNELKNIPTDYFEAKPQRAVGLDEVQAIVIPNTTDTEFKKQLQDAGLNYYEYDPNVEGDRQRVINQFDNLKFSKENSTWKDYLEREFPNQGTRSDFDTLTGRKKAETTNDTTKKKTAEKQPENESSNDDVKQLLDRADKILEQLGYKEPAVQETLAYETMQKYVDTGRDTDFKDYFRADNGNIIARAKNGTYSVIDGDVFIVDGEKIPTDGRYKSKNSSLDRDYIDINDKDFSDVKYSTEEVTDSNGKKVKLKQTGNNVYEKEVKPVKNQVMPDTKNETFNVGDKKVSNFYSNITEKSKFITEENRESLKDNETLKYYDAITNKETLKDAMDNLDSNPEQTVGDFFTKENFTADDVATGWILMKRYQDAGNYEAMSNVIEKMREQGTKSGQAIQMLGMLDRLTPEGMEYYAQKQLDNAYNKFVENKSKKQIEKYANDFTLTAEEHQFIKDQMEKVGQLEDEDAKKVEVAKIVKMLSDKLPPEKGAGIKAWMRIAMLGNAKTQVRNIMGNAIIQPVNWTGDIFGSLVDKAISKKTGVRTMGNTDFGALAGGFLKGGKDAIRDSKLGIDTRDINLNRFEENIGAKPFYENGKSKVLNAGAKALNKINKITGDVMSGGDRIFYQSIFDNSLKNQMKLNKTTVPTQEMVDIATQEALSRTWNDSNSYTKAVLQIRSAMNKLNIKGYGLGDVLVPFAKTPANLTKAIVDYSPAGLVRSILQDGRNLRNSLQNGQYNAQMQHKFADSFGKGVAGSMLWVAAYALAKAGIITGASDDDKDVSNFMRNTLGIQPYSIKIGNKSFTYDWAQPIAAPFAAMADFQRLSEKEEKDLGSIIKTMTSSASNILLEQSFLSSIQDVFNSYNGPTEAIQQQIQDLPARATPTFFKQIADLIDPKQRQTFVKGEDMQTAKNKVQVKIPGASKKLTAQRDTLGREIEKYGGDDNKLQYAFNVFLNPANTNKGKPSEAAQEIYDVYKNTGDKTVMPRQVGYSEYVNGKTQPLTAEERNKWQKLSGEKVEESVKALAQNEKYQAMSYEDKAEVINGIVNYSFAKAKSDMYDTPISTTYRTAAKKEEQGIPIADYYVDRVSKRK